MTEAILVIGLALLVGAAGIALGILAAPAIERFTERIERDEEDDPDGRS